MLCSLSLYTIQRRRRNKYKEKLKTILCARERKTHQHKKHFKKVQLGSTEVQSKHILFCL